MQKHIIVFGKKYKIKTISLRDTEAGNINFKEDTIYINKNIDKREALHTLLHEMGHALFKRNSVFQVIDSQLEETIVDQYATMIVENFVLKEIL